MPSKKKRTTQAAQHPVVPPATESSDTPDIPPAGESAPPADTPEPLHDTPIGFPIVGIGSSAGGLEALEGLISPMPSDTNIAFVIIQHLAPQHKSIMRSLLQKYTEMQVFEVEDGMPVEPNCIYLNPPNKNVVIMNRTLQLMELVKAHGVDLPIDYFFRSLSEDQNEKAICIVLSGTGTDGTLGLKAIKGAGGMAMVQQEQQAKYAGMPGSAINTGMVDYILPVETMPAELIKYVQHPYIEGVTRVGVPDGKFQDYAQKIFILIRSQTGHDFSNYKQTTIRRRIERRLAVHQIDRLADYVRYIQKTPAEVETLFKDMLIGVTNFFRDPDAFQILQDEVLPAMLQARPSDAVLRFWVPGCASGEEAYSLAMLVVETMEQLNIHVSVQVFASDLDAEAIEYARTAVYPDSIAADVSPQRLQRFFIKEDSSYKVKKQLRESVIFAVQNLIKDPPFSRLDLVSCRNVLIYMDTVLQKQLLPMFHYTLSPQGTLFLGSSESIGEFTDLFAPLNAKWKIYNRRETALAREYPGRLFFEGRMAPQEAAERKIAGGIDIRNLAEKIVLDNYAPASVLLNDKYEILFFIGSTDRYLTPPTGEPSFDILQMAREGLRYKLRTALHKAVKQQKTIVAEGLRIKQNGGYHSIDLVVRPLVEPVSPQGLLMVVFDEKSPAGAQSETQNTAPAADEVDPRVTSMEQELQSTREYLQTTIEELETSNEELKSTNEELQSVNEELQSTNEELETSKEELQSTNEELVTVNTELQNKVDELSQANNDINNLLASTDIGTIFLDLNLCIKRFTPAMSRIFNLIKSDIDRPIGDITSNIRYEYLQKDARLVLDTLHRKEIDVQNEENQWYSMRIAPYRTVENIIDGVVITFVDITDVKQVGDALRESKNFLVMAQKIVNIGCWEWNLTTGAAVWSDQLYRIYGRDKKLGAPAIETYLEIYHPDDRKSLQQAVDDAIEENKPYNIDYRIFRYNDRELRWTHAEGHVERDEQGKPLRFVGTAQDITERKQTEESLLETQRLLVEAQRMAKLGSWEYDLVTKHITWSQEVYTIFGLDKTYTPSLEGLAELIHPDDLWVIAPETIEKNTKAGIQEMEYRIVDQTTRKIKYVIGRGATLQDAEGKPVKNFGSFQDITERKQVEEAHKKTIDALQQELQELKQKP